MAQQTAAASAMSKDQLDFAKQQYADAQPRLDKLYALADQVGNAQLDGMTKQNAAADEQQKFWQENYKPTELRSLQEANAAGSLDDQEQLAGRAVADQRTQSDIATQSANRGLMAMGVNPNSGKFAAAQNANSLASAANSAGAATNARLQSKNQGIALRAGAVATGRGMQNIAGQSATNASNIGSAGVNSAATGANGNLGQAGLVQGAYNTGINANVGMFNGYAGLQNGSNQINSQGSGLGQMIGTIGGAYMTGGFVGR
jgi:hypothetical protein